MVCFGVKEKVLVVDGHKPVFRVKSNTSGTFGTFQEKSKNLNDFLFDQ